MGRWTPSYLCVALALLGCGGDAPAGQGGSNSGGASSTGTCGADCGVGGGGGGTGGGGGGACTNPAPEVTKKTCVEAGYAATYQGTYVSTRQLDCHTHTYGPADVVDTCFEFTGPNFSVDLRTYFPSAPATTHTRLADGTPFADYTMRPAANGPLPNTMMTSEELYTKYLDIKVPGAVYVWEKTYGAATPTMAHLRFGDDKSVTEVGDWFATDGAHPDVAFGYSDPGFQHPDGLAWSAAGGLRTPLSDPGDPVPAEAQKFGLGIQRQVTPADPYADYGPAGFSAWNYNHVVETLTSFTPAYGRSSGGQWGAGNAKTYKNVLHVVFYHGTHVPGHTDYSCASEAKAANPGLAAYYLHLDGYHTYASEYYFALGKGLIQETFLYTEDGSYWKQGNCSFGLLFSPNADATNPSISYIDEL
jgi:hypothetical protein